MLKEKDFKALKEVIEETKPSSLEDIAKTIKLTQATLDLFQLPQALRSAIEVN